MRVKNLKWLFRQGYEVILDVKMNYIFSEVSYLEQVFSKSCFIAKLLGFKQPIWFKLPELGSYLVSVTSLLQKLGCWENKARLELEGASDGGSVNLRY